MTVIMAFDDTFEQEVLKATEPVMVEFFSETCGPCKAMEPALQQAADELAGKVKIVKLDVVKNPATSDALAIRAMPTLLLFKGGKVVGRNLGALVQKPKLLEWIASANAVSDAPTPPPRAEEFKMANGLHVVVVPRPQAALVAIRTIYKVGAADDWAGVHMLGALLGGVPGKTQSVFWQTMTDVTMFIQNVSKDELPSALQNDAARMAHLSVTRDGLVDVRQTMTELLGRVAPQLQTQVSGVVYGAHPYAMQIGDEAARIAEMSAERLVELHKQYFAPHNAVVIVSGPVTADEMQRLAEATYGGVAGRWDAGARTWPPLAPIEESRRVVVKKAGAKRGMFSRRYLVPNQASGALGEPEALEVLSRIFNAPGRLVRPSVDGARPDLIAGAAYAGARFVCGEFSFTKNGADLEATEALVEGIIDDIRANGVTDAELASVKESLAIDYGNANFDPKTIGMRYDGVAHGVPLSRIEERADIIAKLTPEDIRAVASKFLDPRRAVTYVQLPDPATEADASLAKAG